MKNMDKQKLQTLKGFRDFLPEEAKKRQYLTEKFKQAFELFGFVPIETPALEYQEILLGKYGEEADTLVYTFTDKGGRNVALRYDQTVPTARILAMYQQNLPMPWRRYQIQPVWRAEKPQRGRFREFLQCDVDIFGSASSLADAEIVTLTNHVYKHLGFTNYKIFVNDRTILFNLMSVASIPPNLQLAVIAAIDKLDRKSPDEVRSDLVGIGIDEKVIDHLYEHLKTAKPTEKLKNVLEQAKTLGVEEEKLSFQARLARGLDYYTSTIFEVKIDEYKSGSVAGGGRYDALIEKLSGVSIPAVGISFGVDRTLEAMAKLKLFAEEEERTGCLVSIFSPDLGNHSTQTAASLRENGIKTELFPDEKSDLKKQLKYADKKSVRWFIVIGPDEAKKKSAILKDLKTGQQQVVKLKNLADKIKQQTLSR